MHVVAQRTVGSLFSYDAGWRGLRLFHQNGRPKQLHELDEATRSAVRVEVDAEGKMKYRSPDKTAAREQAMKHFGLYERDNKQKPFYLPPEFIFVVGVPGRDE